MTAVPALALLLLAGPAAAVNVSDVGFTQDERGLVHIHYKLDAPSSEKPDIGFRVSPDKGGDFSIIPTALSGDAGEVSGSGEKSAVWDVEKDHPELSCASCVIAVEARQAVPPRQRRLKSMSLIPAGPFLLGSPDNEGSDNERPRKTIRLGSYYIDKFLVTVAQFRTFCLATGLAMPTQPAWNKDTHPVVFVNWNEAQAYCAWAGKRLPTEAEWEKAARGKDDSRYSFGNSELHLPEYAWFANNAGGQTHPVAQKRPNAYGLYDMHGNAAQWVADWYADSYTDTPEKNPRGPDSGTTKVLRGGSWSSYAPNCRAASRDWFFPEGRAETNGLRCAAAATSAKD